MDHLTNARVSRTANSAKLGENDDFPTKGNPRSANFPLMKSFYSAFSFYSALNRPYQSLELMFSVFENESIHFSIIALDTFSVHL